MNITETTSNASRELDQAQERMQDLRRTAAERLEARNGTAEALDSVASSVRTTGRQGSERIDTLSESAAGKLDSTAAYVRSHNVGDMLVNLGQLIGKHPTGFLLLAAGIGFLAGSAIQRNKSVT
jgi:hypothetical protein